MPVPDKNAVDKSSFGSSVYVLGLFGFPKYVRTIGSILFLTNWSTLNLFKTNDT